MKTRFYVGLCGLVLLVAYGCGGSAEIERKQAQAAMDKAKIYHAESYAPADFAKAQTSWDHALASEKEGKTDGAKVMFTSAKIFFGKAADIARSKQEALTKELDTMQLGIAQNLDQVKNDLMASSVSSKQKSQVETLVAEVEKDRESIKALATQQDLVKAVAAAKDVQTKIYHAQLILAGQKIK
jgi:hypothetical protein